MEKRIDWLLNSSEPWTRYRSRIDLLSEPETSQAVLKDRSAILQDSRIQELVQIALSWPGYPLKRHSDAKHPLYAICTLADFGLKIFDPDVSKIVNRILKHQSTEGHFQTQI